eukprot:CAMPEP_0185817020 /NCGR_PEP_ID=MMETSP1322-20130828/18415_1 /TAXON_ID=265543 /ORGANISM="Minutocellus polymorphus, Strain RCC2270" /LENGTH=84 /DNA_ID=CAMNT_0028514017 /DNA_START=236 /DNA_END=490 /DNA_ORIENTATION=-
MGTNHAILPDDAVVENCSPDSDKSVIADGAPMQHCLMADRDAISNRQGNTGIGMQDAAVLDVGAGTDCDWLGLVASDCGPEPHV